METTKGKALVLRTCLADMTSHNGFKWPVSGPVECPDWVASKECGNGLHGALWGEGDGSLFNWDANAVWQVVEIDEWIDLNGKVKFPRGIVVYAGDRKSATDYIILNGANGVVIGAFVTAGNRGTATAGAGGTATAGYLGTATAGYLGTATAGDLGTATAGNLGTATAGDGGTATAGYLGTATAGDGGIIQIKHWDAARCRIKTAYVGEDGIEANVAYRLSGNGEFVKS
jgi:hypothetical protein